MTATTRNHTWLGCEVGGDTALVRRIEGATFAFALGPALGEPDRTNRLSALIEAFGADLRSVSHCRQVHGSSVRHVDATPGTLGPVGDGDGLVTTVPAHGVLVWTADCVPVLLSGGGVVAAIHSGWRGCAADVVGSAVRTIEDRTGTPARDLSAAIGPAVCGECYQVGAEVPRALGAFDLDESRWLHRDRVDLRGFLTARLESIGLPPDQIETVGGCTAESPVLASYRRDGEKAGRQWALAFLNV